MTRQRALREPYYDDDEFRGGFFAGIGELITVYPSIAGGSAAFAVIFSYVSANALWNQPGKHPSPIMDTRGSDEPQPVVHSATNDAVSDAIDNVPARSVTTYRIERDDDTQTASIPVPAGEQAALSSASPAVAPELQPAGQSEAAAPSLPAPDPLLSAIQAELRRKGFYGGEIDGLMGPMSQAAISNWQKKAGLEITGEPSERVLESLRIGGRPEPIVVTPAAKPETEVEHAAATPAPAAEPAVPADPVGELLASQGQIEAGGDDLVRRIQAGLSNIAYADVAVDGVAGMQTKNAIRAFEMHYRLPVTGEPNQAVLQKLLEIGAL